MSAIRLRGVVKEYGPPGGGPGPRVRALDSVDLEIAAGERVAIVGPSGSGKTTLLHVLAGIETPTSGEVWVAGQELGRLGDDALTRHRRDAIGLVFQAFHLLPTLSARENVALPALLAGADDAVVELRARALLESVGLAGRADAMPHTLSGGEMQRVALARALVRAPAVLLADEPTGNLDSVAAARVLERLAAVSHEHGATVVLVTHSAEAAAIAGRVVELRDGRVVGDRRAPSP